MKKKKNETQQRWFFEILQEVVGSFAGDMGLAASRSGVKLEEGVFEVLVNLHNGGLVAAPVAVVGGTEDRDHVPLVAPVVTLHHELMGPRHQGQTVAVVEGLGNVRAKRVAGTAGGDSPATPVIGVGPQQVAHWALVGHLNDPVQGTNVVERVNRGGETAVKTENLEEKEKKRTGVKKMWEKKKRKEKDKK